MQQLKVRWVMKHPFTSEYTLIVPQLGRPDQFQLNTPSIKRRLGARVQQALPRWGISPPKKLAGMSPLRVSYRQAYAKNETEQISDGDGVSSSASTCNLVPVLEWFQHWRRSGDPDQDRTLLLESRLA